MERDLIPGTKRKPKARALSWKGGQSMLWPKSTEPGRKIGGSGGCLLNGCMVNAMLFVKITLQQH